MKIKIFIAILSCYISICAIKAQTYYYRLDSYGKTGIENKDVSGGQFITFQAAICMETNKFGESVGNGFLQRKINSPNTYIGSAYWGGGTKFQFSSDKSSLKVYAPNGIIYKYIRTSPPSNISTSSLIKGETNTYIPPVIGRPISKPQKCGICYGTGKCSTCNGTGVSTFGHNHICGACGGYGRCGTCGGSGYSGTVTEYVY